MQLCLQWHCYSITSVFQELGGEVQSRHWQYAKTRSALFLKTEAETSVSNMVSDDFFPHLEAWKVTNHPSKKYLQNKTEQPAFRRNCNAGGTISLLLYVCGKREGERERESLSLLVINHFLVNPFYSPSEPTWQVLPISSSLLKRGSRRSFVQAESKQFSLRQGSQR